MNHQLIWGWDKGWARGNIVDYTLPNRDGQHFQKFSPS